MQAFLQALFLVFVSEMGDKTQVVSFAFGTQYRLPTVLLGVFLGVTCMMTLTVAIGDAASHVLPVFWINVASGILFILFGLWALRPHHEEEEKTVGGQFGPVVAVTATFLLAELGDKTVLASMTVASQQHQFLQVWAGSILGMFLADVIAIFCGRVLGKQLPDKVLRWGSAAIFIGAGLFTLATAAHPV